MIRQYVRQSNDIFILAIALSWIQGKIVFYFFSLQVHAVMTEAFLDKKTLTDEVVNGMLV